MGLDWMVSKTKPRGGCALDFHRITKKLEQLAQDDNLTASAKEPIRKELESALERVSVSAYDIIGAPRIGIDAAATEWFRTHIYDEHQRQVSEELRKPPAADATRPRWEDRNDVFIAKWNRPFEALLEEEKGKYVPALATKTEGLGKFVGMMCSSLDFRGKCVAYAVVLPEELKDAAYEDYSPDAALAYADELEDALAAYKREHSDWQTATASDEYGSRVKVPDEVETVEAAITWMRFWAGNGFGFSAWY